MKTETLIYQTILQRTGEVTDTGDDDLDDEIEAVLDSLDEKDRERVEFLVDQLNGLRWKNEVTAYRTGFDDCLRYVLMVIMNTN